MSNCVKHTVFSIAISGLLALSLARCNDSPMAASDVGQDQQATDTGAAAPVACFSTTPDPPVVATQEPLQLDGSCSGNAASGASFAWDFGDGRTGTGQKVEHQYRRSGEYTVTLRVSSDGGSSEATEQVSVQRPVIPEEPTQPTSCFVFHQVLENDPEPCTVSFDATCSEGELTEYRWFFEGGPRPDLPLPDTNIVTAEPHITYSWGRDEECFTFRPFDRIVRLTVVDENGATDVHAETVVFSTPILKP